MLASLFAKEVAPCCAVHFALINWIINCFLQKKLRLFSKRYNVYSYLPAMFVIHFHQCRYLLQKMTTSVHIQTQNIPRVMKPEDVPSKFSMG
jgi:hypothetical protein